MKFPVLNKRAVYLATVGTSALLMSGTANAQLVRASDLSSAVDSVGNLGALSVTDFNSTTTNIGVNAASVIAEWTAFNVGSGDTVNFVNSSGASTASVLNRVIGGAPSSLGGAINATDVNLWFINQNGIAFGNGTSINSSSFIASTADVANQDFFDFADGTNLFGNGPNTVGFASPSTNSISSTGNPAFTTDGELAFLGQSIDISGTFDSQSERTAFVSASDVDVTFSTNSPLSFSVNAGSVISSLSVGGAINGSSAEFAIFTAAGVIGTMLTVNADVTTMTAVPTDRGITLLATNLGGSAADITTNGVLSSTGDILSSNIGDFTASANITGGTIDINSGGAASAQALTATAGNLDINASTITTGALDADSGGGVILTATGTITTASINSNEPGATNGFIDVQSLSGGTLDLGAITSDGNVTIDTSGNVMTGQINTLGDVTIGGSIDPATVTFTGNAGADAFDIDASGLFTALNIETNSGILDITAGAIDADALTATGGNAILAASGNITTTSLSTDGSINVDSTGGGALDLGALSATETVALDTSGSVTAGVTMAGEALSVGATTTGTSVTFTGAASGASLNIDATGALISQGLSASGGDIDLDVGSVDAGALSATNDILIDAAGMVSADSLLADSDSSGAGSVLVGMTTDPSSLTVTGATSGVTIDLDATGAIALGDVTSEAGAIAIDTGGTVSGGDLFATGGDVVLTAASNIITTSISTDGRIDVDSTGGGSLGLGTLTSNGVITLDTSGSITAGATIAGSELRVGTTTTGTDVTFTGAASGQSLDINGTGALTAQGLTAAVGNIDLDVGSVVAGALSASNDILIDAAGAVSADSLTADSDGSGVGSVLVGLTTAPSSLTVTGATSGAAVDLETTGAIALGDVTSQAGAIAIDAGSTLSAGVQSATGGDATLTANGDLTVNNLAVTGDSFDVNLMSPASVQTGDITTNGAMSTVNIDAGGSFTGSDLTASGQDSDLIIDAGTTIDVGDATATRDITFTAQTGLMGGDFSAGGTLTATSTAGPVIFTDINQMPEPEPEPEAEPEPQPEPEPEPQPEPVIEGNATNDVLLRSEFEQLSGDTLTPAITSRERNASVSWTESGDELDQAEE